MPDPITHATSPWLIAILTAAASYLFDLPLGVVITAAGGAYWAVYRNKSLKVFSSIFLILIATAIAATMVHLVVWVFDELLNIKNTPQRPIAFFLGFMVIDKQFRDWVFSLVKSKANSLEVHK
jgi:hypothetical protein